jgi:hypothetical protein
MEATGIILRLQESREMSFEGLAENPGFRWSDGKREHGIGAGATIGKRCEEDAVKSGNDRAGARTARP